MKILISLFALSISTGQVCNAGPMPDDFAKAISKTGEVTLNAWMRLRGEAMLYADKDDFERHAKYPQCVSGVFSNQSAMDLSRYNGKEVIVEGRLFVYSKLPDEGSPVLPRKILNGSVVPNFCFGTNVLLLKSIKLK